MCKKSETLFLGQFSANFLADWLTLTWKAFFLNCFCWLVLCFQENNVCKKTQFFKRHLYKQSLALKVDIDVRCKLKHLLFISSFDSLVFLKYMFWFLKEVEKQTWKKEWTHLKSNWCHDKTNVNLASTVPYLLALTKKQR